MSALDHALALAEQGFPCIQMSRTKRPLLPRGFNAATCDAGELRAWWSRFPDALVGVATGSPSGLAVLDVDPRNGGDAWLAGAAARLPRTRTHRTRSGGLHLLFQHPPGLRCSSNRPAAGIDVRAEGGGIVWWPAAGFALADDAPPAPWPQWLLDPLRPPPQAMPRSAPPPHDIDRYTRGALISAARRVAEGREGGRNAVLNTEAFSLATRFVRTGFLPAATVRDVLTAAAAHAGLPAPEIARTLASALRSGVANG